MSKQTFIKSMTGFKGTSATMTCKGHQFVLGEWSPIIDGDLELCKRGYHFCVHPSGIWDYYNANDTRVFKIEAEDVLEVPIEAGASFKLVARKIRLIEEVTPGLTGNDKSNTGYSNTGDSNTGNRNTGDSNTGNRNTGDSNTGYSNTGDSNTGNRNTGNRNTGNSNTGYSNTGYSNATDYSSGFFCQEEPKIISFDAQTKLTRDEFINKYPEIWSLSDALLTGEDISFEPYKNIPGITKKKLATLHAKHIAGRKAAQK